MSSDIKGELLAHSHPQITMSTASASTPAPSSGDDRRKDHILHLIAMLFAELGKNDF